MNSNTEKTPEDAKDDALWDFLEISPRVEASPVFLQNTLRRARLAENEKPVVWWHRILAPRPLAATGLAVCAAIGLFVTLTDNAKNDGFDLADQNMILDMNNADDELAILQSELSGEFLRTAAENPDLFSDQEVLAFLQ